MAVPRLPTSLTPAAVRPACSIEDRASERGWSEWSGWGVIKGAIMALSKRPRNNNHDDDLNVASVADFNKLSDDRDALYELGYYV